MDPDADIVYLLDGTTGAGEPIGPMFAEGLEAHVVARESLASIGGTVRLSRPSSTGWREVARYTDCGKYPVRVEVAPRREKPRSP